MEAEYQNFLELRETPLEQIESLTETTVNRASQLSDQEDRPANQRTELTQTDIKAEPKETPELLAAAETVSEQATAPMEETQELPTAPTEQIQWGALKHLTIEVQTRQVDNRIEYRTIVNPGGVDLSHIWSGLGDQQLRQWIRQHLGEGKPFHPDCQ